MADLVQLAILKQGVQAWNAWRAAHLDLKPDLREAYLREADLREAYLREAYLRDADLSRADLRGAHLYRCVLHRGNLRGANLRGANLREADLHEADLRGAVVIGADLVGAHLREAHLEGAYLRETHLDGADLERARLEGAHLRRADLEGAHLREADLRKADLCEANLNKADLRGADLHGANLQFALLVGAHFERANLSNCAVHGVSAWNVHLEDATQTNLSINGPNDPIVTVDDLEVTQFNYLLLDHKKLRNAINAVAERGVLLLGRFSDGGSQRLHALATKLREMRYLPIIFDFDRPPGRNYTETVKILAGLSRFVIADLSGPSVPQELYATVPHLKIPFVPIIEATKHPYSMASDILEYPWVIRPPVNFADTEDLVRLMPSRIVAPAEDKHQARQQLLDKLFGDN